MLQALPGFCKNSKNFREKFLKDLQALREAGLTDTAAKLTADLELAWADLDEAVVKKVSKSQTEWARYLRIVHPGNERPVASVMIANAQATIAPARQAGLPKIADAAGNAVINLHGAIAK